MSTNSEYLKKFFREADFWGVLGKVTEIMEDMGFRFCDECGKAMISGYYDGDYAGNHYCSDECLHKHYTDEEWAEAYGDGDTDCYWSEWEGCPLIADAYNEFIEEKNTTPETNHDKENHINHHCTSDCCNPVCSIHADRADRPI